MSDMGWSKYIRDLDDAADMEIQAREQDMLPALVEHSEYDSPQEMYRSLYKYTACGPWVSMLVNGEWVHCGDLHKLGPWKDMALRGDIVAEILIGSIVEGADECVEGIPVRLRDIQGKGGSVTSATLSVAINKAVAEVDEEAGRIWNDTHGCYTCRQHWIDECGSEEYAVWADCPDCNGDGMII
jgi:hypothetical protein